MMQLVPTSQETLISCTHGRERRVEREIQKIDLQRARKYGMKEENRFGRWKFTYGGIVFITDSTCTKEITCFPSKDVSRGCSGSKFATPTLLERRAEAETPQALREHKTMQMALKTNHAAWSSHSVFVVDMSGSMRSDDVNGARCRSDGVWMVLAREWVARELSKGTRSTTDVVSIVLMRDTAELVMECEPIDWVLYNKLIDMREFSAHRPEGAGNYLPALAVAESLLMRNQLGSCSLSLLFFSDGRPSDRGDFAGRLGDIASKFGRRLSVSCVGMADEGEDFTMLKSMAESASSYGANASFGRSAP